LAIVNLPTIFVNDFRYPWFRQWTFFQVSPILVAHISAKRRLNSKPHKISKKIPFKPNPTKTENPSLIQIPNLSISQQIPISHRIHLPRQKMINKTMLFPAYYAACIAI
jgi:hypothetical protein